MCGFFFPHPKNGELVYYYGMENNNSASSHVSETQEISLRLEHYDDIFSDFDIRPYSKRALSVDFLDEIKRASKDKNGEGVDLVLYVPEKVHDENQNATIKERLGAHFKRHFDLLSVEKGRVMRLGTSMVILGIIFMLLATYIVFKEAEKNILFSFLIVFLEPAAWFLLWEGMDQIIFNSKNINPDLDFYRKMFNSQGSIHFKTFNEEK